MSSKRSVTAQIALEYWMQADSPGHATQHVPVDPQYTDELILAVRSDEQDADPRARVVSGRPQVHLAGPPRALEAFGRYLIALARLDSQDPDVHEHFEDVQNDDGGTAHLIVRRLRETGQSSVNRAEL
jgi:hypothetical protein